MTNGWIDIKNTDLMLIMGGNPAENHPCGFKWAIEGKLQRNAKMIVVDPRFTRTAAKADLLLQIRTGTDTALLGGFINYAIENDRVPKEYLVNYTNASFIVQDGFKLPEDGFFSGFNPDTHVYDKSTWNYEAAAGSANTAATAVSKGGREGGQTGTTPGHTVAGGGGGASQPQSQASGLGDQAQGPAGAKGSGPGATATM